MRNRNVDGEGISSVLNELDSGSNPVVGPLDFFSCLEKSKFTAR